MRHPAGLSARPGPDNPLQVFQAAQVKDQVFLSPGDHYRTRITHTLEVSQIARTIGRALALNEDLVEAIALGHDLGHTPFGHAGEDVLKRFIRRFPPLRAEPQGGRSLRKTDRGST